MVRICPGCEKAIQNREYKQTKIFQGSKYHLSCYNAVQYRQSKEKHRTYQVNLPSFSSQNGKCLFSDCQETELSSIEKSIRDNCAGHEGVFIQKGSRACTFHKESLKSRNFDVGHLNKVGESLKLTPNENTQLIQALLKVNRETKKDLLKPNSFFSKMDSDRLQTNIGMTRARFEELLASLDLSIGKPIRDPKFTFSLYFYKMKTGLSDKLIGGAVGATRQVIDYHIKRAREILIAQFVPRYLGLHRMEPNLMSQFIWVHTTEIAKGLYGYDKLITILDGTYIYIQKSTNFKFQRETYSMHKHRNLLKMFVFVTTDGWILDVTGPHPANISDADLMESLITSHPHFRTVFTPEATVLIVDRGFRNCIQKVTNLGYQIMMPAFLNPNEKQMSTKVANDCRKVTKVRFTIECNNGDVKQFGKFNKTVPNRTVDDAEADFRICCSMVNYLHDGKWKPKNDDPAIAERMIERADKPNRLAELVSMHNLTRLRRPFQLMSQNPRQSGFPVLEEKMVEIFCCGSYQVKMARYYVAEHMKEDGLFEFYVSKEVPASEFDYEKVGIEVPNKSLKLYKASMHSRHSNATKYLLFVLINTEKEGIHAIEEHYCQCPVGKRTVGCCSHLAALIWYLSFACYDEENRVKIPAKSFSTIFKEVTLLEETADGEENMPNVDEFEDELQMMIECEVDIFCEDHPSDVEEEEEPMDVDSDNDPTEYDWDFSAD